MKLNHHLEILCHIQNVFDEKYVDMALMCVSVYLHGHFYILFFQTVIQTVNYRIYYRSTTFLRTLTTRMSSSC